MVNTMSKLQAVATKQEEKIIKLQDKYAKVNDEKRIYKLQLEYLQKNFDKIIEEKVTKAVEKAKEEIIKHYEKIIKEKDQRIFELESRLNINSSNSSLPSSKNPIYQSKICNSREKTNKSIGGQLGHKKHTLETFEEDEITEVKEYKIEKCPKCNNNNLKVINIKIRDELDLEIKVVKRRHKFYEYECLECGNIIKSSIPLNLHNENQYGKNVKTLATTLTNYGFVSYNRTRKIICGLTNSEIDPSEGYLTKLQKKASQALEKFNFDLKEKILKSKINYWDDTVISINEKDKACLRVYTNEKHVLYKAHMAKNIEGMNQDGILQNLPEDCVVMHDHLLHNYCDDYKYKNIECNAHITRKLEGITQNANHKWSNEMKSLLEAILSKRKENISKNIMKFTQEEIDIFNNEYDRILKDGFKEYIEFKHKYEFDKERNLLEFMRDYKNEITSWIKDFSLPYSNNICETLLRITKGKMKISFNFKNLSYAEYFANILSYTETCGKFGINKCEALKRLFEGNPYTVQELDEKTIN